MQFFIIGIILFFCLIINSANSWHFPKKKRVLRKELSPVIFIPGFDGSQVYADLNRTNMPKNFCECRSGYFNIWLNLPLLVRETDCFVNIARLVYHNDTRTTTDTEGVEITVPGWGDPLSVEYTEPMKTTKLGYHFKYIGDMLVNDMGYERNSSLRGAPYDFRKGPNEHKNFFIKLELLVEETYNMNNEQPVTLIAYSMGGPMSLIFLQRQSQKWKDKYINSLITLAAPWGGTIKALEVFAIGDDLGSDMLSKRVMRQQEITMPSLGFLLPSRLFWNDNEILVESRRKKYTLRDLQQFFNDINVPNAWEFRKDTENYQTNLTAPGVKVHCLHGSNVDTIERLSYEKGTLSDEDPELILGDGDGTVNLRSLEGCKRWHGKQVQKISHLKFSGIDHIDVLQNPTIFKYIKKALRRSVSANQNGIQF